MTESGCYIQSHRKTSPLKNSNIPIMTGFKSLVNQKKKARKFYEIPQDWTDAKEMLWFIQKRMDLDDKGMENLSRFTARTAGMESDFKHWAIEPGTGAAGMYQFIESPTNDSVSTAINRTVKNYARNNKTIPQWLVGTPPLYPGLSQHKEVLKLTPEQQTILFLGNLGESGPPGPSSDALIRRVHAGDPGAEAELYEKIHYRVTPSWSPHDIGRS